MGITRFRDPLPWTRVWTPGPKLANFFALYNYHPLCDANGDLTINATTNIASSLDGPIQVLRARNLTVNAPLSVTSRCRGFMPLWDTLTMGAAGAMIMTARGAAGSSKWVVRDLFVPAQITFSGKGTSYKEFLDWIKSTGYCIFDPNLYVDRLHGLGDVSCDWATWVSYGSVILSAAGCGLGGQGRFQSTTYIAGAPGLSGTNGGTGGGASGSVAYAGSSADGAPGRPWGGGAGSAGAAQSRCVAGPDLYGGGGGIASPDASVNTVGGGAGNPGGTGNNGPSSNGADGTGGVLINIGRGNVEIAAGAQLTANGLVGGAPYGSNTSAGGGSSGGGSINFFYDGTYSNAGAMTANGGPASVATGPHCVNGGSGGPGSTQAKSFAQMGWVA
ncbi:hypothetical protein DesfrDRAFT_1219 [Solidesulfovibrio fructosivorans JJ]]|uniref:Uncharacterized protein n=1 Tax=Solidesulfovibrio fructosivorans JJ] TaxID=596151 RepID=E1JUC0_SOLFR|nr:hypothetical protein DesfrDRAFT_1219 [Solidesulfovibrio fructosivorans JJ]]